MKKKPKNNYDESEPWAPILGIGNYSVSMNSGKTKMNQIGFIRQINKRPHRTARAKQKAK